MDSSSLASCKDNKWLNLQAYSGDGGNVYGALVNFFLLYGYLWETIMIVGEFDVMGVCGELCRKWTLGLEGFCEENVWLKARWACTWGREVYANKELVWDNVVVGDVKARLLLMRNFQLVW